MVERKFEMVQKNWFRQCICFFLARTLLQFIYLFFLKFCFCSNLCFGRNNLKGKCHTPKITVSKSLEINVDIRPHILKLSSYKLQHDAIDCGWGEESARAHIKCTHKIDDGPKQFYVRTQRNNNNKIVCHAKAILIDV